MKKRIVIYGDGTQNRSEQNLKKDFLMVSEYSQKRWHESFLWN